MPRLTRTTTQHVRAEDVVADEYARLGFTRRLVLRWVSKDLHHAARFLAANPRNVVDVPVVSNRGPFLGVRPASELLGAGTRR